MKLSCNNMYSIKNLDKYYLMTIKNIIWGTLGLILGIIVNDIVIFLSNKLNIKYVILQNLLQITLCSLVLSYLHIHNLYGWSWQHLTPELFFVSFFFGVQYKILNNVQNSYTIVDELHYP